MVKLIDEILKVAEEEFIDDYERPVLEKYEKLIPTPTDKQKVHTFINSFIHIKTSVFLKC